jgi:hypothetical protein
MPDDLNLGPDLAAIQTLLDPAGDRLDPDRHAAVFAADRAVRESDASTETLTMGGPGAARMARGAVSAGMRAIAAAQDAMARTLAAVAADRDLSDEGKARRAAEIREAASKAIESLAEQHLGTALEALTKREDRLTALLTPSTEPAPTGPLDRLEEALGRVATLLSLPADPVAFEASTSALIASADPRAVHALEAARLGRVPEQRAKILAVTFAAAADARRAAAAEAFVFGDPSRLRVAVEARWISALKREVAFLRDASRTAPDKPLRGLPSFELTQ